MSNKYWKFGRIYSNGRNIHRTSVKTWQRVPYNTAMEYCVRRGL